MRTPEEGTFRLNFSVSDNSNTKHYLLSFELIIKSTVVYMELQKAYDDIPCILPERAI